MAALIETSPGVLGVITAATGRCEAGTNGSPRYKSMSPAELPARNWYSVKASSLFLLP